MGNAHGSLSWNLAEIAKALKISPEAVHEYFTDGRRVSFILERRIATEVLNATLAHSEGAGYDLVDSAGAKWEVRSISAGGIYFCPSYMVGSGRSFDELKEIKGYILSDITAFPDVPFWIVESEIVMAWWREHSLGTTTKISRQNALKLLQAIPK
jgi:AcrR family transcriptional regulator